VIARSETAPTTGGREAWSGHDSQAPKLATSFCVIPVSLQVMFRARNKRDELSDQVTRLICSDKLRQTVIEVFNGNAIRFLKTNGN
jgi:hypothetical protein